jgi:hypothetical protein
MRTKRARWQGQSREFASRVFRIFSCWLCRSLVFFILTKQPAAKHFLEAKTVALMACLKADLPVRLLSCPLSSHALEARALFRLLHWRLAPALAHNSAKTEE